LDLWQLPTLSSPQKKLWKLACQRYGRVSRHHFGMLAPIASGLIPKMVSTA